MPNAEAKTAPSSRFSRAWRVLAGCWGSSPNTDASCVRIVPGELTLAESGTVPGCCVRNFVQVPVDLVCR